jgi:hypothetical protein
VTHRTKLWICVGVLSVSASVFLKCFFTPPPVTLSFVRYADYGHTAILRITNRCASPFVCSGVPIKVTDAPEDGSYHGVMLFHECRLAQHDSQRLIAALPSQLPSTVQVRCQPMPSRLWRFLEHLMKMAGRDTTHSESGFVVSVNLPPRPTSASPPP